MNQSMFLPRTRRSLAVLPFLLALLLGTGLLAGCNRESDTPPLAGASMGGPFTLTSHEGKRVSNTDFEGQYRLIYFGYAYCPDICPVDLQTIGAGLRQLEQKDRDLAAKVQPIFISVDPARDTPEILRDYVGNFHPRLIGLTGTPDEVAEVARTFGVYYQLGQPSPPESDNYLVDHSRVAILYGPGGEPIAIIPHDQGPDGVAEELERWVA